jgi:CDP-diacylglycerol--glycerol-3-phosphate 3-phosphatidyltransferase
MDSTVQSNKPTPVPVPKPAPQWVKKLPNQLTWFRMICVPLVVILMLFGTTAPPHAPWFLPYSWQATDMDIFAAFFFAIAAFTDFLDGWLARKYQAETSLGKLLDPLADKLLVVSALIILVSQNRLEGWVAVLLIGRDLGINALRLAAQDDGIQIPSNWIGKYKTTLQDMGIVGLCVYGTFWSIPFHWVGQVCILLAVILSLVSAWQYIRTYIRKRV